MANRICTMLLFLNLILYIFIIRDTYGMGIINEKVTIWCWFCLSPVKFEFWGQKFDHQVWIFWRQAPSPTKSSFHPKCMSLPATFSYFSQPLSHLQWAHCLLAFPPSNFLSSKRKRRTQVRLCVWSSKTHLESVNDGDAYTLLAKTLS